MRILCAPICVLYEIYAYMTECGRYLTMFLAAVGLTICAVQMGLVQKTQHSSSVSQKLINIP